MENVSKVSMEDVDQSSMTINGTHVAPGQYWFTSDGRVVRVIGYAPKRETIFLEKYFGWDTEGFLELTTASDTLSEYLVKRLTVEELEKIK